MHYPLKLIVRNLGVLGLAVPAALALAIPVYAQTTLSGNYNNHKLGDGYDATVAGSPYTVTPTATFNNNIGSGLYAAGTVLIVNGGTFIGDIDGLDASGTVTINGGTFSNNMGYGVSIGNNTTATITGGTFGGNVDEDIIADAFASVITVYGTFPKYGPLDPGSGYFTGTLENATAPQTIHYANQGTIILATAPVPEASTTVSLGLLLALGIGGLVIAARRKKVTTAI